MSIKKLLAAAVAGAALYATPASALFVTAGPGGFDGGFATAISFEDDNAIANRGTADGRDNPLNALGSPDGDFFEIGLGSVIELTFGTLFDTDLSVFEITFGDRGAFPETADVEIGRNGIFQALGSIDNSSLESAIAITAMGAFDTVRITDTTASTEDTGGFDVDAVRVQPVPLPAGILFMLTAMGGLVLVRRRQGSGRTVA